MVSIQLRKIILALFHTQDMAPDHPFSRIGDGYVQIQGKEYFQHIFFFLFGYCFRLALRPRRALYYMLNHAWPPAFDLYEPCAAALSRPLCTLVSVCPRPPA